MEQIVWDYDLLHIFWKKFKKMETNALESKVYI